MSTTKTVQIVTTEDKSKKKKGDKKKKKEDDMVHDNEDANQTAAEEEGATQNTLDTLDTEKKQTPFNTLLLAKDGTKAQKTIKKVELDLLLKRIFAECEQNKEVYNLRQRTRK